MLIADIRYLESHGLNLPSRIEFIHEPLIFKIRISSSVATLSHCNGLVALAEISILFEKQIDPFIIIGSVKDTIKFNIGIVHQHS